MEFSNSSEHEDNRSARIAELILNLIKDKQAEYKFNNSFFYHNIFLNYPAEYQSLDSSHWRLYWLEAFREQSRCDYQIFDEGEAAVFRLRGENNSSLLAIDLQHPQIAGVYFFCSQKEYYALVKKLENFDFWQPLPICSRFLYDLCVNARQINSFEIGGCSAEKDIIGKHKSKFVYYGEDGKQKMLNLIEGGFGSFSTQSIEGAIIAGCGVKIKLRNDGLVSWNGFSPQVSQFTWELTLAARQRFEKWKDALNRWEWNEEENFAELKGGKLLMQFNEGALTQSLFKQTLAKEASRVGIFADYQKVSPALTRILLYSLKISASLVLHLTQSGVACFAEQDPDVVLAWELERMITDCWGQGYKFILEYDQVLG